MGGRVGSRRLSLKNKELFLKLPIKLIKRCYKIIFDISLYFFIICVIIENEFITSL